MKQLKVGLHEKPMHKRKSCRFGRNIPERIPIERRHSPNINIIDETKT